MSSEIENTDFRHRLSRIIGDKKPFRWAAEVGISKGAFDRIWNKGSVPSAELLIRIHRATGVSIDWLLTGEGQISPSLDALFDKPVDIPEKIKPVFNAFMEIMRSDEEETKLALTQNTYEFRDKIRLKRELTEIKEDMATIKRRLFNEPREADFKTQGAQGEDQHQDKQRAGGNNSE